MEDEDEFLNLLYGSDTEAVVEEEEEEEEEDEFLNLLYSEEEEEKEEEEDLLASDPTNTVVSNLKREGNDITFAEFNNTPEEDLQGILESKYGNWLEFDEPIVFDGKPLRGANLDVIQITNPQTGDTKDFDLGTDYNQKRGYYRQPRDSYNDMITWITGQRRDKDGKYINEGAKRTLGDDYLVDTELGDLPLEVSTQIQDLALKEVLADETGELTMEQAIDDVVNTSFGKMNTAWRSSIVSQEAKETVKFNDVVEDMVKNKGADFRFTEGQIKGDEINQPDGDTFLMDESGNVGSAVRDRSSYDKQVDLLIELGVPKDVFFGPIDMEKQAAIHRMDIDPMNPSSPESIQAEYFLEKTERVLNATIKEQIEEYLNGSQQWGANTLGPKIKQAYSNAANKLVTEEKEIKALEDARENTKVEDEDVVKVSKFLQEEKQMDKSDADKLALDQVTKGKADETINNYTNEFSQNQFKQDWSMSDDTKKKLDDKKSAILNESDPEKRKTLQKELKTEIRDLLNDDNITFLKDSEGNFVSKELQAKSVEAQKRKKEQLNNLNDYLYKADSELTQELFSQNNRLEYLAKEINQQGYGETMIDATVAQQVGEGLDFLGGLFTGSTSGTSGGAYNDFQKIKKLAETGEMPVGLTTLPESSGASDLIREYNDLLEKRSTLLLVKELNVDPLTYEKANTGIGRFFNATGAGLPAAIGGRFVGEKERKQHAIDVYESAFGLDFTDKEENFITQMDGYESAGDVASSLIVMTAEMMATYALTGGAGNIQRALFAGSEYVLGKTALSEGTKLALSKYAAGVGTEYVGLIGSNMMEEKVFNREGIHNPLLFASSAGVARGIFSKGSDAYTTAVRDYANKAGNERFKKSLLWISEQPMTATEAGAIKYSTRVAQSGTRTIVKGGVLAGEATTGAIGIKVGETGAGLADIALGNERADGKANTISNLLNDITDPESLFETAGALLFMKGSRPDQYVNKLVGDFYAEMDMIKGNNPAWNRMRAAIGQKRLTPKQMDKASSDPNYIYDLQDAYAKKLNEISKGEGIYEGLDEKGRKEAYDNLNFTFNRLKLKPAIDQIVKDFKDPKNKIGDYSELELASLNLSEGGFTAANLLKIAGVAKTSQSSVITQLKANGFTEKRAQEVMDFAEVLYADGKAFGGNVGSKAFENYTNESLKQNQLKVEIENLNKSFKKGDVSEARYKVDKARLEKEYEESIDKAIDIYESNKKVSAEETKAEIQKAKEEGLDIMEMNDAEMKKFMEENDGNFSPTTYGMQGTATVDGVKKGVALVNTEAAGRDVRRGTATHELFHFPFERKLGEKALEIGGEKAKKEAEEYMSNFKKGLKDTKLLDIMEKEMQGRSGYTIATIKKIINGDEIPMSEMKEFLNEFIQMDKAGAFDQIKSKAQIKASESQSKKVLSDAEYSKILTDPEAYIDFVLQGKYKSKNINELLKKEQDAYNKELVEPDSKTDLQASERTGDVNELALSYETEGGNELWKTFGADDAIKQMKDNKMLDGLIASKSKDYEGAPEGFVDKVYAELVPHIRNYKPERQNESGLFGWVNPQIKNKAAAVYNREYKKSEIDQKSKRLSDKVDKEGNREFDVADQGAREAVESAGESKSNEPAATDRQVSVFEGSEAKAREKEILDVFKDLTGEDLVVRSKKGLAGTPKSDLAKVADLLFNKKNQLETDYVSGDKLISPSKNLKYDTYVAHTKTSHDGKPILDNKGNPVKIGDKITSKQLKDHPGLKGVLKTSEFKKVQDYFKSDANMGRFLRTLPKYSFIPNEARINSKGETIDISKDVLGRGLGLPKKFVDYFYEPLVDPAGEFLSPSGRTKGGKVQLQPGQAKVLKPKFRDKISNNTIKEVQDALLIGSKEAITKSNRGADGASQLGKGFAMLETMKVSNEATRKPLPKQTEADKQFEANLRAGSSDFAASERMVKGMFDIVELLKGSKIVDVDKIIADRDIIGLEAEALKKIPLAQLDKAIKNGVVDKVMLKTLVEMDLASPESMRVLENIAIKDIARREGITEQQVKDRYIKNAWQKNAKELLSSLGFAEKSGKDRGSEANFKKAKPYLLDFIQRNIPEGSKFADLSKPAQNMLLKTLGMGDGTLSTSTKMKDGSWKVNGQQHRGKPFTYKQYNLKEGETVELLKKAFDLTDKDLIGTGKDNSSWVNDFYYPGDWGGKGRNILKIADMEIPFPDMLKRFTKNYKGRGQKDMDYDTVLKANKEALKSLYNNMKDVIINSKDPRAALEHMIDLQLSQTNRASGGIKGLVGMESVTTKGERSNLALPKEVHNEHLSELFSMTKDFSLMMDRYIKGEQTIESVDKQLNRMVEDANQALITEKRRAIKDASGAAVRDYMNNLIFLGKDAKSQIPLKEGAFGEVENMLEFIRDKATSDLIKQIKETPYNKLTEIGVLTKQRAENSKDFKEVKNNNIEVAKEAGMNASERSSSYDLREELKKRDKATALANKVNKPVKKIRVFDFDDTVGTSKNKVFATKDGKKKVLNAEQFAKEGLDLIDKGWEMDFSDFNKVTEGGKGPLFDLMKTMKEAKGKRDMFILTARAPEAAPAIHEFLKQMGIDIPLENITGLGNSTGKAKADWIVEKASKGYNDFYFADDAPQNVKAVRDALELIDVKSQVQQARMNASERLSEDFNKILEEKTGIGAEKIFSDIKAEIRGNKARKQKFFIPPSAEDFLGLLYATLPKGKKGEAALDFYQKNLFDPYTRATDNLSTDRVNLMADFKALKKQLDVPKDLRKETKSGFTNEQAVRTYLWAKTGKEIPGLSKSDFKELNDIVENDPKLKAFAEQILSITKGDGYSTPGKNWAVGTITTDLIDVLNTTKRAKYLEPWKENADIIFSKENLNKLEAAYGRKYREAMENVLTRMKSGSNRIAGGNRLSNQVLDYINNSTGVTMFFNTRSALLQTISAANFVNWSFNNPLMAGKAFANQPQYWKDFTKLMNSDYLIDRRNGLKLNINESEIADAAKTSKNKAKAVLNYILEKGYTPTKYADSFAIASGGAMFYRNRVNDLVKKGMGKAEAEAQAMKEFKQVSEKSQQSSDPSKISQQQSGDLGRIILQYANTPMQYARIQKRAIQDIANGRGDMKHNLSKVIYYSFLQNLMFNALQQGAFALGFGDDFSDDEKNDKTINTVNGMLDSSLRGLGMGGVTLQVLKNLGLDIYKRSKKKRPEYSDAYYKLLEFSPAIKSKLSRFKSAAYPFDSKKRRAEVFDKGFSLDNPAYESMAKVITAVTNVPLDRMYSKINNLKDATADDIETWQAIANVLGWPTWQLEPKKDKKGNVVKPKLEWSEKAKAFDTGDNEYSEIEF